MSESVKIGGIGKNPAIDRINSVNSTDIKDFAAKKLESLILGIEVGENEIYKRNIPIDFSKINWKGKKE